MEKEEIQETSSGDVKIKNRTSLKLTTSISQLVEI